MKQVLAASKKEFESESVMPCLKVVIDAGFSLEEATQAYSAVGDNPDLMISYLLGY